MWSHAAVSEQCNNFGDVRLVRGTVEYEGIVEVCQYSEWGTVCADHENWDIADNAIVVCRQLGYRAEGE